MTDLVLPAPTAAIEAGRPLVSVIVPCYGEGRYLDDCLWSIRNQTYAQLEIIVIDDAGTDDSLAVALDHSADRRVHVARTDRNVGLGAIRNLGIDLARGDLLAFVDGDDMLPPDSIRTRVAAFASLLKEYDPSDRAAIAGVYGDWQYTTPDATAAQPLRASAPLGAIDLAASGGGNIFTVSAPLVRRDIMGLAGGFAPDVAGGEDLLAWRRVLELGVVFAGREKVVHLYRQKPTSMLRAAGTEVAAFTVAARERADTVGEPTTPTIPIRRGMQRLRAFHQGAYPMAWGKPRRARTHMAAVGPPRPPTPPPAAAPLEWTTHPPSAVSPASGFGVRVRDGHRFLDGPPPTPPDVGICHFAGYRGAVVTSSTAGPGVAPTTHDVVLRPDTRLEGLAAGVAASRLTTAGCAVAIAAGREARTGVLDAWFLLQAAPDAVVLAGADTPLEGLVTLPGDTTSFPTDQDVGLRSLVRSLGREPGSVAVLVDADVDDAWIADAQAAISGPSEVLVGADSSSRARSRSDTGLDLRALPLQRVLRAGQIVSAGGLGTVLTDLQRRAETTDDPADLAVAGAWLTQLVDQVEQLRAPANQ